MNWVTSLGEETPEHYLVTILDRKLKHMKTSPGHTLPSAALAPQSSTLPVSDLLAEASCMPSPSTDGMPPGRKAPGASKQSLMEAFTSIFWQLS